jgi:Skp family chaperone for outer membrane proteins
MTMPSRAAWALGLGLLGFAALVVPNTARSDNPKAAATNPTAGTPAVIGVVDLDAVLKQYEKVKAQSDQFKADAMAKQSELVQMQTALKKISDQMKDLKPESADYKKLEAEFTKQSTQLKAESESAQQQFARREAESLGNLYKEVQTMVGRVAKYMNLTHVMRVSNEPITGNEPNSVMAAMARSVVYADPKTDITQVVIHNLNLDYGKTKVGATAKPAGAAPKAN